MLSFGLRTMAEFVFLCCVVCFILSRPSVRELLRPLSRTGRCAVWGFFLFISVVQVIVIDQYHYPQKTELFPFTRFAMFQRFGKPVPLIPTVHYEAITESGANHRLNQLRLLPSMDFPTMHSRHRYLEAGIKEAKDVPSDEHKKTIEGFGRALAERARLTGVIDEPIREILFVRDDIALDQPSAAQPVESKILYRFSLEDQ